jgi:hypothetical protein
MQKLNALEILGWFGGLVLILAYALNSTAVLDSQTLAYQGLNLLGSLALAYYTFRKKAYPNVALNLIWAGVGIFAIVGILNGKGKEVGLSMGERALEWEEIARADAVEQVFSASFTPVFYPKQKKAEGPRSFKPFNLFLFNYSEAYFLPKICLYRAWSFITLMASNTSGSRSKPI